MDAIERAERRYGRIAARAGVGDGTAGGWLAFPAREILAWLEQDVARILELHAAGPEFRRHARWALDRLVDATAGSPERAALDEADAAIVAAADALLAAAAGLRPGSEPRPTTMRTSPATRPAEWSPALVESVAGRPWAGLVSPYDYFTPSAGLMLRRPGGLADGEMIASLNPELPTLGDLVSRCALRRIESWAGSLAGSRRAYLVAATRAGHPDPDAERAEASAWGAMEDAARRARAALCGGPAAALRDDCIVLAQAYAAFAPEPDLDWLGLPRDQVHIGVAVIRNMVEGRHLVDATDRIAASLASLRSLGGPPGVRRAEVDRAVSGGGLVILLSPRRAYWEAAPIDVDWDRYAKPWELLRVLASKAKLGAAVAERDLYADAMGGSAMANRWSNLKPHLPASLRRLVVPERPRRYKLGLPPGRVAFFDAG